MKKLAFLFGLSLLLLTSCNRNVVLGPEQYQPRKKAIQYIPFGSWMNVEYKEEFETIVHGGEIIVIDTNRVLLLDLQSKLIDIPIKDIRNAKILLHQSDARRYGKFTILGVYTSIPLTGPASLFLMPAWILTGTRASLKARNQGYYIDPITYPWEEIAIYARFPKGLPEGIDLSKLKAKEFGVSYKLK